MRKYLLSIAMVVCCVHAYSQRHVILISIDGLRPEFYLDKSWPAPNLQKFMKEGVYAKRMKSVFPSFTYPSHVAMLTGALPARSGIYYNARMGSQQWYWFTKDIKVPTLWQALSSAGLTTAAVQWPVSVDSSITYNIPEIWSVNHPEDRISETRKYATKGLIEEIEVNVTGTLDGTNMNEEHLSLDKNAGTMAAYLFRKYKPNLLAVHFACVDGAQHEQGREGEKVKLAVANADQAIGEILKSVEESGLKEKTTIVIVGDHGFIDMTKVLRPNAWIKGIEATFQPAGGSAFLYSKNDEAVQQVNEALRKLPSAYKQLFKVYDREQLDKMGVDSSARLALAAVPGIIFSGAATGEQLTAVKGGHHGYDPSFKEMYTGFIAAGAGVLAGRMIRELCVTDIAPLIASLLRVDFNSPDGRVVKGILQ